VDSAATDYDSKVMMLTMMTTTAQSRNENVNRESRINGQMESCEILRCLKAKWKKLFYRRFLKKEMG